MTATTDQPSRSVTSRAKIITLAPREPSSTGRSPHGTPRWLRYRDGPPHPCAGPPAVVTSEVATLARQARRPFARCPARADGPMALTSSDAALDDLARRSPRRRDRGSCTSSASRPGRPASPSWRRPLARDRLRRRRPARAALEPPGRGHRPGPRRAVAWRSPPARRRASRSATRLPDRRGGRPTRSGPAPRCCSSPPRRWPRTSSGRSTDLDVPGLVAATYDGDSSPEERTWVRGQRQRGAHQPRDAAPRPAPPPRPLGHVPHAAALRRGRRAAHAARRVRHPRRPPAAPAAPAVRALRLRPDLHVLARPPSASPAGWPRRCAASTSPRSPTTARPAASALVALWNPPLLDAGTGRPGVRPTAATAAAGRRADPRRPPHHRLLPQPARAPSWSPPTCGAGCPPTWPAGCGPTAAATSPPSGARSRPSCSAAGSRGVVATTALELGIDVGGLDACVLNGFPGTIASMWQQAGRAGREAPGRRSPCSSPATTSSTSGFMAHPDEVFTRPPEPAVVNPANPYVLDPHLACAAYEQPLAPRRRALVAATCSTTASAGSCSTTG